MLSSEKFILIVDDIQPARETIRNILRVLGHKKLLEAANGQEAVDLLLEHKDQIQLVISDWKMPVMNGLELLRFIRQHPELKNLLFIFTTSKGEKEDIAVAAEEGVQGYLIKPVTIENLSKKLKQFQEKNSLTTILQEALAKTKELIKTKQEDKALKLIDQTIQEYPALKARLSYEAALIAKKQGNFNQAKNYLTNTLKETSLMLKSWSLLATIYIEEKEYALAIKALENVLEIHPSSTANLFLMGKIYLWQKNLYKAKEFFVRALNSDPNNLQLKQDIWNTYLELDLTEQVMQDFGALLFEALTVDTLNNLAVSFRKLGKVNEAIKVYKQALKKEPDNETILYNLAIAFLNLGNKNNGIKYLRSVLEKNPDFTQAKVLFDKLTGKSKDKNQEKD